MSPVSVFSWYRCQLSLQCTHSAYQNAHPLSVYEAIVKGITIEAELADIIKVIFYCPHQRAIKMRIKQKQIIQLEIDFFNATISQIQHWQQTALSYFDKHQKGRNFSINSISEPLIKEINTSVLNESFEQTEVCLDFYTPLPFAPPSGYSRCYLTLTEFKAALITRIKKLFAINIELPTGELNLLPYYWTYHEIAHYSASQAGHIRLLNGCVGRLYIKAHSDVLATWLPWLQLAESIGLSKQLSFGLGRFGLLTTSPAFFNAQLTNPKTIEVIIHRSLEQHPHAVIDYNQPSGINTSELAQQLADTLHQPYLPQAYQTFSIAKPHGGFRLLEKASFNDSLIQKHLLNLITDNFNHLFTESSIGFRKGLSRKTAITHIQDAIADGYRYVIKTDIADFFPSISLSLLQQQLDQVLPQHDTRLREILTAILFMPRSVTGELQNRVKGLAMGSPLSPLLANLYLHYFDEKIKQQENVRLIRFADDFVILTRELTTAEQLLTVSQHYLTELGLQLASEKTTIGEIAAGFSFLGYQFSLDAVTEAKISIDMVRKPLYVTEAFTFLGIDGDSVEVRQGHSIMASVPLHRISEILLVPCAYSSALIERCLREHIAVILASQQNRSPVLLSGYTAQHYQIAYEQLCRFNTMSDAEKLAVAQALVVGKIDNYRAWFAQHYKAGDNILLAELQSLILKVNQAITVEEVRGFEGSAAKKSFIHWTNWLEQKEFSWQGRQHRPSDRLNSLLNFGYHLLACRLSVLIRAAGLNPFVAFLHEPTERYEVLVYDLMELFRPHIDRLVVNLVNLTIIKAEDFIENEQGFWLNKTAKKRFLSEFARELERQPLARHLPSLSVALALQVKAMREFLLSGQELYLFSWKEPRNTST